MLDKQFKMVTRREAEKLNVAMYTNYGHTLRGVWGGLKNPKNYSIEEFNDFVYDESMMSLLGAQLQHNVNYKNIEDVQDVVQRCTIEDIQIGILSNAPERWCKTICDVYGVPISKDLFFTSDHSLFLERPQRLKPDRTLMKDIASIIQPSYVMYVDDSLCNIESAMHLGWLSRQHTHKIESLEATVFGYKGKRT
jgi:FMN phosphatase YigB (HAD superfamily)